MEKNTIRELYREFGKNDMGKAMGMKFMFPYNGVEISAYFDGYDEKMPMLILIVKYKQISRLISCNMYQFNEKSLWNEDIPDEIAARLQICGSYRLFYDRLIQELGSKEYVFRNYKADLPFKQLEKKNSETSGVHPFFGGLEKGDMEESYMEILHERFTISWELLLDLKKKGISVRTVEKCKERKKIGKELEKML